MVFGDARVKMSGQQFPALFLWPNVFPSTFIIVMKRILVNTRDELICIDVDAVAYLKAAGNFTELYYVYSQEKPLQLSMGITKLYDELVKHNDSRNLFFKIGRSHVVNDAYLRRIRLDTVPLLYLGDSTGNMLCIKGISKVLLRAYKDARSQKVVVNNQNNPQ